MTVATGIGDLISGEKITYCFGKVSEHAGGRSIDVSFGLNGEAAVAKRWRRAEPGERPDDVAAGHDLLIAKSARGQAAKHREDGLKASYGSHRAFTGVLIGGAMVSVTIPRDA